MTIKRNKIMTIKRNKKDISGAAHWLAAVAVLIMGLSGIAWGQTGTGISTNTTSTTQSVVLNPPTTTTTNVTQNSNQEEYGRLL